jgi:hypothetical protein
MRMAMADADDSMTAIEVQVLLALGVPDFATFAAGNGDIHEGINVE